MHAPNPGRSRCLRGAVAVLALSLGSLALLPPAHAQGRRGVRLRVMAYNIQAGGGADHGFDPRAHGAHVWVYVTHLDHRPDPAVRRSQVADMTAIMARRQGAKLLLGDFNAEPGAPEPAPLRAGLTDALTVAGQRTTPTWPSDAPSKRIDYVTLSSGVHVTGAYVPDTLASDHRPVVAELKVIR